MPLYRSRPFVRLLFVPFFLMLAVTLAASAASAQTAEFITFEGAFSVTQGDFGACSFSDSPFTLGDVEFAVLIDQEFGRVDMSGGGEGLREGLRCNDQTGDLQWAVDYMIEAEGPVAVGGASFSWEGTVQGAGWSQWVNCQENGQPVQCPAGSQGSFSYPVVVSGSLTCEVEALGEIRFPTLANTSGEWGASVALPDGWSLTRLGGEATLNGTPLLHNCPVPVNSGDELKTTTQAKLQMVCYQKSSDFSSALTAVLNAIEQPAAALFYGELFSQKACRPLFRARSERISTAAEPPLGFDLQRGALSLLTSTSSPAMVINAPQASAQFGGARNVIARAYSGGSSEFAALAGTIEIVPANPNLTPFTLGHSQQVAVENDRVGAIVDLSQANLPYISCPD